MTLTGKLFRLWQHAVRGSEAGTDRDAAVELIALVNDSGFGKTSVLCSFAASLNPCQPVLFLQARHLLFGGQEDLVRAAVQTLQGVLSPELVREEEAEVVHQLRGTQLSGRARWPGRDR